MKNTLILFVLTVLISGCKSDKKNDAANESTSSEETSRTAKQSDGLTLLKGDFIYYFLMRPYYKPIGRCTA
jgi:hypothetical protein